MGGRCGCSNGFFGLQSNEVCIGTSAIHVHGAQTLNLHQADAILLTVDQLCSPAAGGGPHQVRNLMSCSKVCRLAGCIDLLTSVKHFETQKGSELGEGGGCNVGAAMLGCCSRPVV
jgi:hypothetical protein